MLNKRPFVIGITGGSGSGKTFFLNSFLNHFPDRQVTLVSQDDYYIPVGKMTPEENKRYNFDLPETIDERQFLADLELLIAGKTVYKQAYCFNNPNAVGKMLELNPAPILVVEGLFIFHFQQINSLLNMRIFIEADEEIALERRIKRDLMERGYPKDDVVFKWHSHVLPAYHQYLLPYRQGCDEVIINNLNVPDETMRATEKISNNIKRKLGTDTC